MMIMPSAELMLAVAAVLISIWCAVGLLALRTRCSAQARELKSAQEQFRRSGEAGAESPLSSTTTAGSEVAEPPGDPGRLNRSARARALKLLRAGVPPDAAATTLELPKKDLVLLSRVAAVLSR